MRRSSVALLAAILLVGGSLVALFMPRAGYAAAPDVRIVTPAGITIDGSAGDWDSQSADFLADMYTAGNPDKPVLAKAYGRYDCGTLTFYIYVQTIPDWVILPSNNDNYVKLGQTQKLVDGNDSGRTQPPAFAYIGDRGWEVAFDLAPGSYTGDGGLNVHAEVTPAGRADTAAVANRRMDVVFSCPTPTPTPTTPPTPTAAPTEPPSAPPSEPPSEPPSVEPESPSAPASESPSLPSELPSGSELPSELPSEPASESPSFASESPSLPSGLPSEVPSEPASESPTTPPTTAPESPSVPASELPSEQASGEVGPTESPAPTGTLAPETGTPPLIIGKVDNKGTTTLDDDKLVGGATFEVRVDDGDGKYEPGADDGAPVATFEATKGYQVFQPTESGDFWIEEVDPPRGLALAKPMLVKYDATDTRNCAVVNGDKKCKADEDGSGGFVVAVISDAPVGHPLPATDTLPVEQAAPSDDGLWLLIQGLAGAAALALFLGRPARRGSR